MYFVFVELPESETSINQKDEFGSIESVKTVSSLYAPISGTVTTTNESLENTPVRIESWRAETILHVVDISDNWGMRLHQEIDLVAHNFLEESTFAETGRYDGYTKSSIASIAAEPSVAWIGPQPSLTIWNDQSRNHININAMEQYYTTALDGGCQIVAVA